MLSIGELFVAFLTSKASQGLVEVFQSFVALQAHFVLESARTEGAFEWSNRIPVVFVLSHVKKPLMIRGKCLSTNHTFIGLVFWMVCAEVKFQGAKVGVLLPTVLTTMESVSFMNSLMLLIHLIAAEVSAADLTIFF